MEIRPARQILRRESTLRLKRRVTRFHPRSMADGSARPPAIYMLGEAALLVCFPNKISNSISTRVHLLAAQLREKYPDGLIDLVPAYSTLLITFDPTRCT